jgi:hypothetical protein
MSCVSSSWTTGLSERGIDCLPGTSSIVTCPCEAEKIAGYIWISSRVSLALVLACALSPESSVNAEVDCGYVVLATGESFAGSMNPN